MEGKIKVVTLVRAAAQGQTHRLLSNNEFLHFLNLGHVVLVSLELSLANPLIYPHQHLSGDVFPIIHSCQRMREKREKD